MAYRTEKTQNGTYDLVFDGWENGIAASPYKGVANVRNLNTSYYPGVAYVNYERQGVTLGGTFFYAEDSVDEGNNTGWIFGTVATPVFGSPVQSATSPAGVNYILDNQGQVWKQNGANSSTYNKLGNGDRLRTGAGGIAYWNNYIVVFGDGVIEFCGDGTGDAGITSANWNVRSGIGSNTINVTAQTTEYEFVLSPAGSATAGATYTNNGQTFTVLNTIVTSSPLDCTGTGGPLASGTLTKASGTGDATITFTSFSTPITGGLSYTTVPSPIFQVGDPITFTSTGTLPAPLVAGTVYYILSEPSGGLFQISTSPGGSAITFTTTGTGTITLTDISSPLPIGNVTNFDFTITGTVDGATSFTIVSYTKPDGTTVNNNWEEASGQWAIVGSDGTIILAVFTNGSDIGTFLLPFVAFPPGPFEVHIVDPDITFYTPYVSKVDGNLYFSNGRYLGRILAQNANVKFNPGAYFTYIVDYGVASILQSTDIIVSMTDLQGRLVLAGNFDIYNWDYVSPTATAPSPVGEQIYTIVNLLNNVYILAGTKGNIYISNGYSAQLLTKIPDFIAGVIDPVWLWGGLMTHRSRLWFQTFAQTSDGTNILAGIFSLTVSPSAIGETAQGLIMESQNSIGLNLPAGSLQNGILIDNEKWSDGVDNYYSAYSTSSTTGVIDFNDDTLWQDNEPVVETDIAPIGDFLDKHSFGNLEFKLDRQMAVGDSISLYWRGSLTDSYTFIKTTTDLVLSDYKQSDIAQAQWVQFMATMNCAATGSSRIPLREIRLHFS